MARTTFAQDQVVLGGVDGVDPFANAENPDSVNGNDIAHSERIAFMVWNQHATDYIQATPKVQRSISEGSDTLVITPPTATQIDAGEVQILGPFSASNFKKASDGKFEIDWTLEAGTIADTDVLVAVVKVK